MGQKQMNVKQALLEANLSLTEKDFASHYSDLYVLDNNRGVFTWLKHHYRFASQITRFVACNGSAWSGLTCIEVPFANQAYWDKHCKNKKK